MKNTNRYRSLAASLMALSLSMPFAQSQGTIPRGGSRPSSPERSTATGGPSYGAVTDSSVEVGTRPGGTAATGGTATSETVSPGMTIQELEAERLRHLERVMQIERALQAERIRQERSQARGENAATGDTDDTIIIAPDNGGTGTRRTIGGRPGEGEAGGTGTGGTGTTPGAGSGGSTPGTGSGARGTTGGGTGR